MHHFVHIKLVFTPKTVETSADICGKNLWVALFLLGKLNN